MIADARTAERIGAGWLRAALAPAGDFGRRAEDAARPFGPGDETAALERCARIVALADALDRDGAGRIRAALKRAPDLAAPLSRARAGDTLGDVDFFEVGRFADALEASAAAWRDAGGDATGAPPVLPELAALLAAGRTNGAFFLADGFAPDLAGARAAYGAADEAVQRERARLHALLAPALGFTPDGEEFIVMRDVLAHVPAGARVVRETPAYRMLAVEFDAPALAAADARDRALHAVYAAEERARRALTAEVARLAHRIEAAAAALGELDRTLARVAFAQRYGGCVPEFSADRFALTDATYAPLRDALADEGLPYTPISVDVRGTAVLTGPNMGGKSAALATCGFIALCIANGVPPPAARAVLPLFASAVWIGGESDAGRTRLLSSFGREVIRVRDALGAPGGTQLVLADEFARTTGPREGRALLVALVETLRERRCTALVATHFDGVARAAGVDHLRIAGLRAGPLPAAAADLHAALDAIARAMDYRVVPAERTENGSSDALEVAALLGLDRTLLARAKELYRAE